MKKLLYALAFILSLSTVITSCTDENVTPTTQEGGGGGDIDPLKR